jgi:hypothetical protein
MKLFLNDQCLSLLFFVYHFHLVHQSQTKSFHTLYHRLEVAFRIPSPSMEGVLYTAELLEQILLNLDLNTLLHAQRVSKWFLQLINASTPIQQALFFQPYLTSPKCRFKHDASGPRGSKLVDKFLSATCGFDIITYAHQNENIINPLIQRYLNEFSLQRETAYWPRLDYDVTPKWPAAFQHACEPLNLVAFRRSSASWRRMLPVQPPPIFLAVEFERRNRKVFLGLVGPSEENKSKEHKSGICTGLIYDLCWSWWNKRASSDFSICWSIVMEPAQSMMDAMIGNREQVERACERRLPYLTLILYDGDDPIQNLSLLKSDGFQRRKVVGIDTNEAKRGNTSVLYFGHGPTRVDSRYDLRPLDTGRGKKQ